MGVKMATIRHDEIKAAAIALLDDVDGFRVPFERLAATVNRVYEDVNEGEAVNVSVTDVLSCLIEETMVAAADDSGILLYIVHDGESNAMGLEGLVLTAAKLVALHEKGETLKYSMEMVELVEEKLEKKEKQEKARGFLRPASEVVNDGE